MPTTKPKSAELRSERCDAYDAVVVGAGPAGLAAATALANSGLAAVLLVDAGGSAAADHNNVFECFAAPVDDPAPVFAGNKVADRVIDGVVDILDFDGWFRTLADAFPAQRDALCALFLEIYAARRTVSTMRADATAAATHGNESAAELWSRHGIHDAKLRAVLAADCFASLCAPPDACSALAWIAAATLAHDHSVLAAREPRITAAVAGFVRCGGAFRPHSRVQRVLLGADGESVLGVELVDGSVIECGYVLLAVPQTEAVKLAAPAALAVTSPLTGFAWTTLQVHITKANPALHQGQTIVLSKAPGAFTLEDWGVRCSSSTISENVNAAPMLATVARLPDGTAVIQASVPIAVSAAATKFDATAVRSALIQRVNNAFGNVTSTAIAATMLPLHHTESRAQGLASHGQKTAVHGLFVAGSWTTPNFGGVDGAHVAGKWAARALLADHTHDMEMATLASDLHLQRVLNRPNATARADERPLAVVGLSCRFPGGAHSATEFWDMLCNGRDGVCTVPAGRWDARYFSHPTGGRDLSGKMCCSRGGFVDIAEVYGFEPSFFGISAREAQQMDAQQRMLLRVSWEAMEDAGVAQSWCYHGKDVGVMVGASSTDDAQLRFNERHRITTHTNVGSASSILANRISYAFDLRGPSFVVDTACSSSLVALTAARDAMLRSGPWGCSAAIVAGVNVLERPEVSVGFSKLGVLGAEGVCRAFDAAASGYVRGEGCGAIIIAHLADVQAQQLRPYALLRGAGVNSDGHAVAGIFNPSAKSQATLMRSVYSRCGVRPIDIAYVEAHGTGTPVGDPVEARAIGAVFGTGRQRNQPVFVGSVKSNIGHLEPASGIAGLIKTCLALSRNHEPLPPTLHLTTPNPAIDWNGLRVQPLAKPTEWPAYARRPLLAAVNSFGFGGTNGHAVLEALPDDNEVATGNEDAQIVMVTAKTSASLRGCAEKLGAHLSANRNETLRDVAFTTTCHRM